MLPLKFKVTQNTDIVFENANFVKYSCSNLTSVVSCRTILVTICSFCQQQKCIQINWTCKPVKAVISNDNNEILLIYSFIRGFNNISILLLSRFVYKIGIIFFVKLWVMLNILSMCYIGLDSQIIVFLPINLNMSLVRKRTVSLRHFFWVPTTYVLVNK